ncbi:MAG: gamma-butyrobetaine hydroxylase-like domain-containing protein, partial [Fidelibacterota bacterium]
IPLRKMRDQCPCAECGGERDALGNVYMGYGRPRGESGYQLVGFRPVGYYAMQPFWADGHNTGIYRFELLKELGEEADEKRSGA